MTQRSESNEYGFPKSLGPDRHEDRQPAAASASEPGGESLAAEVSGSAPARTGGHPGGPPQGDAEYGGGTFGDEGGGGSYSGAHGPKGSIQSGGPGRGMHDDAGTDRKPSGNL